MMVVIESSERTWVDSGSECTHNGALPGAAACTSCGARK